MQFTPHFTTTMQIDELQRKTIEAVMVETRYIRKVTED